MPLPQWFDPVLPEMSFNTKQNKIYWNIPENVLIPKDTNDLAFYSILQLASLIKHKKITSVELTKFFISTVKAIWRYTSLCNKPDRRYCYETG
ncbi:MAG: hypothetical protein WKG06_33160 [Segetibacter sp.]